MCQHPSILWPQGSDGSGTSDEEEFDDDQMFQIDDKIAAALRVMAKGGANAKESREAISSFKFRVIGLLDIYVKKACSLSCFLGLLDSTALQTVTT